MDNKKWCVYLHTVLQKISGYDHKKYYVGITSNIENRWRDNGAGYKGQVFYNAIKKYGWDNIKHKVLYDGLTLEKAQKLEKEMIVMYDSKVGHHGYNVSDGGDSITKKKYNAKNIFCIDNSTFYHSSMVASEFLDDKDSVINSKIKCFENNPYYIPRINKSQSRYCLADNYYWLKKQFGLNFKTYWCVSLKDGLVYPNSYLRKNGDNKKVITIDKYIEKKYKGYKLDNKYLKLKDYLYLFDKAKLSPLYEIEYDFDKKC